MPLTDSEYSTLNDKLLTPLITSIYQDFTKLKSPNSPYNQLSSTLMYALSDEANAVQELSLLKKYGLTPEARDSILKLRYIYLNIDDEISKILPKASDIDIGMGVLQSLIEFMQRIEPKKTAITSLPFHFTYMERIRALFLQFMATSNNSLERALLLTKITVEMEKSGLAPAFPSNTNFIHLIFICGVDGYFADLDLSNLSFKSYPGRGYFTNLRLKGCNLKGTTFDGFIFSNPVIDFKQTGLTFNNCSFNYLPDNYKKPDLSLTFAWKPRLPHLVEPALLALATPEIRDEKKANMV